MGIFSFSHSDDEASYDDESCGLGSSMRGDVRERWDLARRLYAEGERRARHDDELDEMLRVLAREDS